LAWKIVFTSQAQKDSYKIQQASFQKKVTFLLDMLALDPFSNPPTYEKLKGKLEGFYSRRINIQHRLIYKIYTEDKIVQIIRMWTHYE